MRTIVAALVLSVPLSLVVNPAFAQRKSCDDLRAEIKAKLDAKGVKDSDSRLAIVRAEEVKDQKIIGSCEAGTKKITYVVPDDHPDHHDADRDAHPDDHDHK